MLLYFLRFAISINLPDGNFGLCVLTGFSLADSVLNTPRSGSEGKTIVIANASCQCLLKLDLALYFIFPSSTNFTAFSRSSSGMLSVDQP